MTIQYKKGNLVFASESTIVHGCNAQGVMRSGVAKDIAQYYPQAFITYHNEYKTKGLNLGTNIPCYCAGKLIINAITQQFYGKDGKVYASLDAIRSCLRELARTIGPKNSIAMPKIGCGLGGLTWEEVLPIISDELKSYSVTIYTLD